MVRSAWKAKEKMLPIVADTDHDHFIIDSFFIKQDDSRHSRQRGEIVENVYVEIVLERGSEL